MSKAAQMLKRRNRIKEMENEPIVVDGIDVEVIDVVSDPDTRDLSAFTTARLLVGEPYPKESKLAIHACNDYLRMGVERTLIGLWREYQKNKQSHKGRSLSVSEQTIYAWSSKFGWAHRADLFDRRLEEQHDKTAEQVVNTGLALAENRVVKLKRLAALLEQEIFKEQRLWLKDVKQIGAGKHAIKVDLLKFNSPLVEQYRKTMDDLAKETGGRVRDGMSTGVVEIRVVGFDMEML